MKTLAAALALLWLVFAVPTAWADASGPIPIPKRDTSPRVRFDNLDDYPDYVFHLEYPMKSGKVARVTSGEIVVLDNVGLWVWATLIAIPQRLTHAWNEEVPPPEGAPGVLRAIVFRLPGRVFVLNLDRAYLYPYRVSIENGKLSINHSEPEPIRPEINLGFARIPIPQAALLLSLAITLGGIYYARKRSAQVVPTGASANETSRPLPSKAARVALYLLLGFLVIIAIANFAF